MLHGRLLLLGFVLLLLGSAGWASAVAQKPHGSMQSFDVLLAANATQATIMMIDAHTGTILNPAFISDTVHLSRPRQALPHRARAQILVADQLADAIYAYDLQGNFVKVFAGQPFTSTLDNIRSMTWLPDGELLVTLGNGPNAGSVYIVSADGELISPLVEAGTGGLSDPYDVLVRQTDLLVSDPSNNAVYRYGLPSGNYLGQFAALDRFPQQLAESNRNTVLVADFAGVDLGVLEYTNSETATLLTRHHDPQGPISGYRGVQELDNGHLLVGAASGLYEMARGGAILNTLGSDDMHYIERMPAITDLRFTVAVTPGAGLSPTLVMRNEPVELSFSITNTSAMTATQLELSVVIPDSMTYNGATGNCTTTALVSAPSVLLTCTVDLLAPGASTSYSINLTPLIWDTFVLKFSLHSYQFDLTPENNGILLGLLAAPTHMLQLPYVAQSP